jgi:protein SCO1/2
MAAAQGIFNGGDSIGAGGERFTISRPKKVGPFSFVDQTGTTVTQADFAGKIYITDFFFTTCQSICIPMGKNMSALAKTLKDKPDVLFLSHTVHPENDSVPVLAEYARLHQADPKQWHLVTGDKKSLYDMARFQYFIDATVGNGGPEDFLHSDKFTLVDKQSYIRGYYDGTLPSEMERLKKDITLLEEEERLAKE